MLNRCFFQGRLVADPDLKTTQTGLQVCSFRLACDRDYKDKQTGQRETDWISCVAWRQTAEFVSRYFTKGQMAVVVGQLQTRQYQDRDGNKRTATEVIVSDVYFSGDKRRDSGQQAPACQPQYQAPAQQGQPQFQQLDGEDENLPF